MVDTVLRGDRELVRIAGKGHNSRAGAEQLGVLDRVSPKATDAEDPEYSIGTKRARISQFLDAAIGRETGIGERSEFLECETRIPP